MNPFAILLGVIRCWPTHQGPDEWATTKQACRDELVVYLSYIYIYILQNYMSELAYNLNMTYMSMSKHVL